MPLSYVPFVPLPMKPWTITTSPIKDDIFDRESTLHHLTKARFDAAYLKRQQRLVLEPEVQGERQERLPARRSALSLPSKL